VTHNRASRSDVRNNTRINKRSESVAVSLDDQFEIKQIIPSKVRGKIVTVIVSIASELSVLGLASSTYISASA
jgi:hypothetical protein